MFALQLSVKHFGMGDKMKLRSVLKMINNYCVFFLTVAFAVTCCMLLFLHTLAASMGIEFNADNVTAAAKITFGNVMLITFLFGTVDWIRRKLMVERPVKMIVDATEKIMKGDFSVRMQPMYGAGMEGFNQIVTAVNAMAKELEGIETLRTDFIANVSHEMKTPLSVMQNYGTLLQSVELSEEKRLEYAKGITDTSRRMADMMTNILKLNRLENQQIYPQVEEFDLGEQICECLLQYENVWEKKEIEIEVDIAEDVKVNIDTNITTVIRTAPILIIFLFIIAHLLNP